MKDIDSSYAVSTHQPMIKMALEYFKPKYIVELGMGLNSTPIFLNYDAKRLFVENDPQWIEYLKSKLQINDEIILHQIPDGYNANNLPESLYVTIMNFYIDISYKIIKEDYYPKLLFVDNFISCRNLAISLLYSYFDIIIYHDADPAFQPLIGYNFNDTIGQEYNNFILKNNSRWTGCLIKKSLNADEIQLKDTIKPYIDEYCNLYNLDADDWKLEINESRFLR